MGELTQEHFEEYMESFAKMVKEGFDATASKDATATKVDLDEVKFSIGKLDERVGKLDERVDKLEKNVTTIRATMVTKDYLDDKLADLRGDLVVLMRKEDTKLKKLIEKLHARNVLNDADVQEIVRMEPFAVFQT
ncbi:MAG: hypothetical protein V1723_04705 [Candidatus Uhrbacteria bacterium]